MEFALETESLMEGSVICSSEEGCGTFHSHATVIEWRFWLQIALVQNFEVEVLVA
jgi:hypothetical protein